MTTTETRTVSNARLTCPFCGASEASHRDENHSYVPCVESIGATVALAPLMHDDEDKWPATPKWWHGE